MGFLKAQSHFRFLYTTTGRQDTPFFEDDAVEIPKSLLDAFSKTATIGAGSKVKCLWWTFASEEANHPLMTTTTNVDFSRVASKNHGQ